MQNPRKPHHFPKASFLSILRAFQKDNIYLELFEAKIRSLINDFWVLDAQKSDILHAACKLLYYMLTSGLGRVTPGEEYFQICLLSCLPKANKDQGDAENSDVQPFAFPFAYQRILFLMYYIVMPKIATRITQRQAHNYLFNAELNDQKMRLNRTLEQVQEGIFIFSQIYPTVAHFVASLQYVALRPLTDGEQKPYLKKLGSVYLMATLADVFFHWRHTNQLQRGDAVDNQPETQTADSGITNEESCLLCLDTCKHPTVARCGHIFCWNCLVRWTVESGKVRPFFRWQIFFI